MTSIACPFGRPCDLQSPSCFGRLAPQMCGDPRFAGLLRQKTANREAAGKVVRTRWGGGDGEIGARLGAPGIARPAKRVLIRSHLYSHGGYGRIAFHVGRGLDALGIPVAYEALELRTDFLALQPFVVERLLREGDAIPEDCGTWDFNLTVPGGVPRIGRGTVFMSMWEVDRLPLGTHQNFNAARLVIVPCRWNAEVLRTEGVTVPIRVVPLGVDPDEGFRADEPIPTDGPTIFGTAGKLTHGRARKGCAAAIRAFVDAFPNRRTEVRLKVKIFTDDLSVLGSLPGDPRIEIDTTPMTPPMMADWYKSTTVGFYMTCGEGWGLHLAEHLACGRPIIAPLATAVQDYADEACTFPLAWTWKPARDFYGDTGGNWAEPDHDSAVEQLRRAHRDRGEVIRKGRAGAGKLAGFSWGMTARMLKSALVEAGMIAGASPRHWAAEDSGNGLAAFQAKAQSSCGGCG